MLDPIFEWFGKLWRGTVTALKMFVAMLLSAIYGDV